MSADPLDSLRGPAGRPIGPWSGGREIVVPGRCGSVISHRPAKIDAVAVVGRLESAVDPFSAIALSDRGSPAEGGQTQSSPAASR